MAAIYMPGLSTVNVKVWCRFPDPTCRAFGLWCATTGPAVGINGIAGLSFALEKRYEKLYRSYASLRRRDPQFMTFCPSVLEKEPFEDMQRGVNSVD